ncbi:MAG TPA: adenylosuccinate synthase [Candidatus Binatia bacterium]|nr:adenylosuccinate synthase [Candidatus Binatia bacterium]
MTHTAVIGMQWGDEGKGKIVDYLAQQHDVVVRYAGGGNAGHTVVVNDDKFVLHLVPCGAVYGKTNVIGNGVVVNFDRLEEEVSDLNRRRQNACSLENFRISERAHVITPYHLLLDLAEEVAKSKRTGGAVGTTMQGIGPAYQLKMGRTSMRVVDLMEDSREELAERVNHLAADVTARVEALGISPITVLQAMTANERAQKMTRGFQPYFSQENYVNQEQVLDSLLKHQNSFRPFVSDISYFLTEQSRQGKRILFEGAQGTLLDIDHGTYPHVTSSNTTLGGVDTGTGTCLPKEHRLGILKAYTTRVGNGEFPTEDKDAFGKCLQDRGCEYGATTGRPRRCGALDLVIAGYATRVNGINELAVTKLDVLDEEKEIPVCIGYEMDDHKTTIFPASERMLKRATPIYTMLPGWQENTSHTRRFDDLPPTAQYFIKFIENNLHVPVKYVSIGEKRDQVIVR